MKKIKVKLHYTRIMRKDLLLLLFIGFITTLKAELIQGPAEIRSKPRGEIILKINDGVFVEAAEPDDSWYHIGIHLVFEEADVKDGMLQTGAIVYSCYDGQAIGEVLAPVNVETAKDVKDKDGKLSDIVKAYAFKSNIVENSMIEFELERLVNEQQGEVTEDDLGSHLVGNHYKSDELFEGFRNYKVDDKWQGANEDRVRLLFQEGKLMAVFYNRSLDVKTFSARKIMWGFTFTFHPSLPEEKVDELIDQYRKILTN